MVLYSCVVRTEDMRSIIPDDGRSGRGYAASHASMPHPEDEAEISNGLEALHM